VICQPIASSHRLGSCLELVAARPCTAHLALLSERHAGDFFSLRRFGTSLVTDSPASSFFMSIGTVIRTDSSHALEARAYTAASRPMLLRPEVRAHLRRREEE
jgi:hypothetical protein